MTLRIPEFIFGVPNVGASFVPIDELRAMIQDAIDHAIEEFRVGARNAMDVGFDGIEVHGGNGCLIDEFLRSNSNVRTDKCGEVKKIESVFLVEVAKTMADEVGTVYP